jgi:hypothetical protein
MPSYILTVVGYPVSESNGSYEWSIAGARGKQLAAGRGTLTGHGHAASLAAERLTYHALLAGLQALLAEDYAGALTIAAAPAFIALPRQNNYPDDPDLQRLRRHASQLLNQIRGELTLQEQLVIPPLMVSEPEPSPRAAKPLPPHVAALVTQLNANLSAVTDEDFDQLQIRGYDTYSRMGLPDLLPLVEPVIIEQAQAAFPDAPASQAVVLRWHLRGLNLELAIRKARLAAQIEARKIARSNSV